MKIVLVFILTYLISIQAYGCRTEPYERLKRSFDSYFDRADLVITAEVIKFGELEEYSQVVLVKPLELWKGDELDVYPIMNRLNTSCSREFKENGGPYIIFASWLADLNMYQIDMLGSFVPVENDKEYWVQKNLNRITKGSN